MASAGRDRTVRVWDATTGKELLILKGHTDSVTDVSFSPDGQRLASASGDRTIRVWDVATGKKLLTLKGHTGSVGDVSFSPDGQRLASASSDRTVRVWDATTGRELLILKGHTDSVTDVSFSPGGRRLASADNDGTVHVWEALDVTDAVWRKRGLVREVDFLFERPLLQEEVIGVLRRDPTLDEDERKFALEVAESHPENPAALNNTAWRLVKSPNARKETYARALRHAEAAVLLTPEDGNHLGTLGVAQYRAGRYADALATLSKSEKLNATKEGSHPADLSFLAMTQHQLGKKEEAKATLARLRTAMKQAHWANDAECAAFLREAEELIEGKGASKKP